MDNLNEIATRGRPVGKLYQELSAELPPEMQIPEPLERLYEWIEARGMHYESESGNRIGQLFFEDQKKGWMESIGLRKPVQRGTDIMFCADRNQYLKNWFGFADKQTLLNRLCIFACTGKDGSTAALWLGDDGKQRVVHMGSGSGSTLLCVLAEDMVDFLRLLAIGYDEICWNEQFDKPPDFSSQSGTTKLGPNEAFREWVMGTFDVTIPETASEIVKHPAEMDDERSEDIFFQWVKKHTDD